MSDIAFENVSRVFERDGTDFLTLDRITFGVRDREFVAIVGPSGCGKTTCLRWKTVHENIDFGLRGKGLPAAARRDRIARQVELMSLQGYESAYPHQLSGGMQQRVAIARSYVLDPDVLLMDEPFGALDAQTRIVMQEELIKLSRVNPRTVLFITHAVDEAVYLADRVVVMTRRPGRIREIVDVAPVRKAENWDRHDRTEEVMDQESFVHLRTHIWRMLRGEQQTDDPKTLETTGGMT